MMASMCPFLDVTPQGGERQLERPFEGDQPVPAIYLKNEFRDDSTHHSRHSLTLIDQDIDIVGKRLVEQR